MDCEVHMKLHAGSGTFWRHDLGSREPFRPHRLFEESSTFAAFALEIDEGDDGEDGSGDFGHGSVPMPSDMRCHRAGIQPNFQTIDCLDEGRVESFSGHHNTPR